MTAPTAVYLACPCGGRAEVDPSNWIEPVECETCGREWLNTEQAAYALATAGYAFSSRHGWRTDEDARQDSWNCECEDCHQGEVPRW